MWQRGFCHLLFQGCSEFKPAWFWGSWGVGLFLEQGVGAHSQSGGRRRSHGYDVIALASDWRTHK